MTDGLSYAFWNQVFSILGTLLIIVGATILGSRVHIIKKLSQTATSLLPQAQAAIKDYEREWAIDMLEEQMRRLIRACKGMRYFKEDIRSIQDDETFAHRKAMFIACGVWCSSTMSAPEAQHTLNALLANGDVWGVKILHNPIVVIGVRLGLNTSRLCELTEKFHALDKGVLEEEILELASLYSTDLIGLLWQVKHPQLENKS